MPTPPATQLRPVGHLRHREPITLRDCCGRLLPGVAGGMLDPARYERLPQGTVLDDGAQRLRQRLRVPWVAEQRSVACDLAKDRDVRQDGWAATGHGFQSR